ncbi:MAG: hypothetical protein E6423_02200 [Clostridium sp.]|nr:hypothetical protein [Clostridium sp.]DAQ20666.1 MAG TPA: hypothetical protein [Caudoviricetes sp.]
MGKKTYYHYTTKESFEEITKENKLTNIAYAPIFICDDIESNLKYLIWKCMSDNKERLIFKFTTSFDIEENSYQYVNKNLYDAVGYKVEALEMDIEDIEVVVEIKLGRPIYEKEEAENIYKEVLKQVEMKGRAIIE